MGRRYPRLGQPLAPMLLQAVLDIRVPARLLDGHTRLWKFSELNENAWKEFSIPTCRRLANAVVEQVRQVSSGLPIDIGKQNLLALPEETRIADLDLDTRTRNCLRRLQREGRLEKLADLKSFTVYDLLGVRAFGAKCLVDLLTAMEARASAVSSQATAHAGSLGGPALPQLAPELSGKAEFELLRDLRLPKFPHGVRLEDLPLQLATYRWLRNEGFHKNLPELRGMTVGQLFKIPGFDISYLLDLLGALQRYESYTLGRGQEHGLSDPQLVGRGQAATLEEELMWLASCRPKRSKGANPSRNQRIAMRYLGFDGCGGGTLREVGSTFGLTRERVRQICNRLRGVYKRLTPDTPLLQKCIEFIAEHVPCDADELEEKLVGEKLTARKFRTEGIIRAAELLGLQVSFELQEVDGRRIVVAGANPKLANAIISATRKSIRRYGVTTVVDIAGQVEKGFGKAVDTAIVSRLLQRIPDFKWLDQEGGWFALSSIVKNRVANRIRKILSVAARIRIAELRTGIARHHAMKGYAPPKRVLRAFCVCLPGFRVEEDIVLADPPLDWQSVLRGAELTMARVLKEHGPIMKRTEFEELCVASGMKRPTFYVYLDYSPIIERYASGVYGLRGAEAEPGQITSLVQRRRAGRLLLDHGWSADGKIWIGYRLSDAMIASGVFSIPAAMKRFLDGEFVLKTADDFPIGTLAIRPNGAWGLSPLFRRRGGDADDTLVLRFDLGKREAVAQIGDEDLLDDLQMSSSTQGQSDTYVGDEPLP